MTEKERYYLEPLLEYIYRGYTEFEFHFPNGQIVQGHFDEIHEPYYEDDIFELDFTCTKVIRNADRLVKWRVGSFFVISLESYPEYFKVLG